MSLQQNLAILHRELTRLGLTLATAESATGGWIAKLITDKSGSSKYFKGGIVSYSNFAKREILDVPLSDAQSAVRKTVAISMAENALKLFKSDLTVAVTGYMEPTTALKRRKQTGVVFISVARRNGKLIETRCRKFFLNGTRQQNRVSASTEAVHLVIESIRVFARGSTQKRQQKQYGKSRT